MKKTISLVFTLSLLFIVFVGITPASSEAAALPTHLIINQVYGRADKTDAAISHSFIELYNPTSSSINLAGWSIQYAKKEASWKKLDLTGTIPSKTSFLIRCASADGAASRYTISVYDMDWSDRELDNDNFKIALCNSTALLTQVVPPSASVVDFAGFGETVDGYEVAPVSGISKQKTARRLKFSDIDNNAADFKILDYRTSGIDSVKLNEVKPRSLANGAWGQSIVPDEYVPYEKQVIFSKKAGLYTGSFPLTLTTEYTNATIRYTTDGSDPTASSAAYTAPITIKDRTNDENVLANYKNIVGNGVSYNPPSTKIFKGTTVKARVFSSAGVALSSVFTSSYFVSEDIMTRYKNLPILSITTDKGNFFDTTYGIYVNNHWNNSGDTWERPVHFEMFETDGSLVVSQDMGIRVHGAWTRNLAQKSLRLYARASYDSRNPKLKYDIFQGGATDIDGNAITSFENIVLRNGGNDNGGTMFRDVFMQKMAKRLNVDIQAARQSVVFLNGEFWGIYNIRQRYDEHYFESKYHFKEGTVAMISLPIGCNNNPEVEEGDQSDADAYKEMYNFFNNNSMSNAANYAKAKTYIDIDNFIDYYCTNIYINNNDWPNNNNRMWRYKSAGDGNDSKYADGRWRWYLVDTDFGFGQNGNVETNELDKIIKPNNDNPEWATLMFRRLLENSEFKALFVNRMCDNMNTAYKPVVVKSLISALASNIQNVIPEQSTRWKAIGNTTVWNANINTCNDFADRRTAVMQSHMKSGLSLQSVAKITLKTDSSKGINSINGISIDSSTSGVADPSNWSGEYFASTTQKITADAKTGYVFSKFIVTNNGTGAKQEYTESTINVTISSGGNTVEAVFENEQKPVDLIVSNVTPSVATPKEDDVVAFIATIRNESQNDLTKSFTVTFILNNQVLETVTYTKGIEAGGYVNVRSNVTKRLMLGMGKMRIIINENQSVVETNYKNNNLAKRYIAAES